MPYSFAVGGDGWSMVPCMRVFLAEVEECSAAGLLDVTNLGQLGDRTHQAEPTSRHNPARAPNGNWYVCAADFGGKDYSRLADFHQYMYRQHDPRVYSHGFCQWGDGYGLSWYDGGREWTGRDQGHCHFDVTMAGPSLGSGWWVDSLASTDSWGLADYLSGHATSGGTATPITEDEGLDMSLLDDIANTVKNIGVRLTDMAGELGEVRARVARVFPDDRAARITLPDGSAKAVPAGTANSVPNCGLDEAHGNVLVRAIRAAASADAATSANVDKILAEITDSPAKA